MPAPLPSGCSPEMYSRLARCWSELGERGTASEMEASLADLYAQRESEGLERKVTLDLGAHIRDTEAFHDEEA